MDYRVHDADAGRPPRMQGEPDRLGAQHTSRDADRRYQEAILVGVSRTFALTIPQLPTRLSEVVSNAYLLCRLADTIEDEPGLNADEKRAFAAQFVALVRGAGDPGEFARALSGRLTSATLPAEKDLVTHTAAVLRLTKSYGDGERHALARCIEVMAEGMVEFQDSASLAGLDDLLSLDRYCYHVAGVVGDMLTALFCEHSEAIARERERLMELAPSFGQGLQMTNILKDVWEDCERGACWLPRAHFKKFGFDLDDLARLTRDAAPGLNGRDGVGLTSAEAGAFQAGLSGLVGVAHHHLHNALEYTLIMPRSETGIRRFCLWAIGMAILTLRKVEVTAGFRSGQEVKISRNAVRATMAFTSAFARSNAVLRSGFAVAARGLPLRDATGQLQGAGSKGVSWLDSEAGRRTRANGPGAAAVQKSERAGGYSVSSSGRTADRAEVVSDLSSLP